MFILGQISTGGSEADHRVAFFATLGLVGFAVWKGVKWLVKVKPSPDPWDAQTAAEIARDDAVPLCYHCLCPHSEATHFCSECGTTVGQFTNWLPFPQLFSIGHVLRIGTFGNYRCSLLTVGGFWILGLVEYTILAPFYWAMLLRNKSSTSQVPPLSVRTTDETSAGS